MSEYLATGRGPEGKKVTERVEADSADEAMEILRDRGFEEIVLHTDDVSSRYSGQGEVDAFVSPGEYLWFRHMPGAVAGFLLVTIKIYQKSWLFYFFELALLLYRRYEGHPWSAFDSILAGLLVFPMVWALGAQFVGGAARRYQDLIEAAAWGRWEEVLRRADSEGGSVAPEELAFRKGQALAGLGRLDEALRAVEPFSDGEVIPEWLYLSRLPDLYLTAKRPDAALAAIEDAVELAPDNAVVLLDAARMIVWERHDPRRARELLEEGRTHALSDVMEPFATYIEGMIRLEEGQAHEARALLESAYQGAARFRHASPLMGSALDQMHVSLALACAGEGDTESTRRHYQLARPRLEALKLDESIARCERAVGPL